MPARHDWRTRRIRPEPTTIVRPDFETDEAATTEAAPPPMPTAPGIDCKTLLGAGGMGFVWLGAQSSLRREVAVKVLRPEAQDERSTLALLAEAHVTGRLEHPSIVPIHDVRETHDGMPCIVMKRIEGEPWSDLFDEPAVIAARFGVADPLEWNLEVFQQVCRAVSFAHSRGILHRDIKPENVMIGSFGEVYLLDWGIAVGFENAGVNSAADAFVPFAGDAHEIAGTPCYLAPEMTVGDGKQLTARTDVYLLGATLYEVLSGQPPHIGLDLAALVESARRPVRTAPLRDVPEALADVVLRALDPEPEKRFESAESLRAAVRDYVSHRGSELITQEADRQLFALVQTLEQPLADPEEWRRRAYRRFGECRFGFLQALRVWPQNRQAREGLECATKMMVELELRYGTAAAAESILAEQDLDDPKLAAKLRAKKASEADEAGHVDELRRLGRDMDPEIERHTRVRIGLVMAGVWTAGPLFAEGVESAIFGGPSHYFALFCIGGTFLIAVLTALFARDSLGKTAVNRWATGAVLLALFSQTIGRLCEIAAALPVRASGIFDFLAWFCVMGILAMTISKRLAGASLAFLAAAIAASLWPENLYYIMFASNAVLMVSIAVAWPAEATGVRALRRTAPPP